MQPINAQCQEETEDELKILEGKNRLILKIQKYLIPWNFRIDEHQISILLVNMNHLFGNSSLEEIYTELAYDQTNDEEICQWALQYKTRGRIQLSNGNSLPAIYNWKNTKIAQCCKPNFEDEIIGSIWKSPKDPKHPAYQRFHELKIHKMNCPAGPKENKLAVTWSSSDSHKNGFVVEALINDAVGCLGEFLNIFYNTNLSIHSVRADAINFQNKASIGVHATAFTRDELETTKELIIKRYGIQSITTRYLRNLEVAQLTCQKKSNPYIISSEPELEKNLPVLFFGREDELRKLAFVLHDHRSRRVLVNGYYRIGKTWFLKQFKLVYHMPSRHIVNILVNNIQLSNNPIRDFVHEIYLQTIESLEDEKMVSSEILQRPQNFSELKIWFERVSQKTRRDFILLMDEFSVISDWEMNKKIDRNFIQLLRNFIFNVSNVSFVLVFQTSYIYNLVDISTNFRDDLFDYFRGHHDEEIELKPFGPKETYKLITKPVSDNYQFSKSAINYAYQLCGGVPFIGALLGKTIWDYAQERNLRKINKNTLLEITRNIKNNQQWSFYIETLVNNLREKDTFLVLRKIAELEHETNTDQITEEMVRDKLNIKLERIREALDALKRTDLVETNHEFCKIRGTLLSTYLANIE